MNVEGAAEEEFKFGSLVGRGRIAAVAAANLQAEAIETTACTGQLRVAWSRILLTKLVAAVVRGLDGARGEGVWLQRLVAHFL